MKIKKYSFSCKGSCTPEAINTITATSLTEAIENFAAMKRLPVNQFLQLYEVSEKNG